MYITSYPEPILYTHIHHAPDHKDEIKGWVQGEVQCGRYLPRQSRN